MILPEILMIKDSHYYLMQDKLPTNYSLLGRGNFPVRRKLINFSKGGENHGFCRAIPWGSV